MKTLAFAAALGTYTLCAIGTTFAQKATDPSASPKLSGLYRAFSASPQFGAAVGGAYVFSASGDVYKGWIGTQPPEKFDFARARVKEPGNSGKYTVSGDKILFRWNNKESETAAFSSRRDPKTGKTNLSIGPNYCYKLVPWNKALGSVLSGTFTPNTYQGGFSDENPKTPKLLDSIRFSRDGSFAVAAEDDRPAIKGRYRMENASLVLLLSGGEERKYSLHVFEDRRQPIASILIDGRPFSIKTM